MSSNKKYEEAPTFRLQNKLSIIIPKDDDNEDNEEEEQELQTRRLNKSYSYKGTHQTDTNSQNVLFTSFDDDNIPILNTKIPHVNISTESMQMNHDVKVKLIEPYNYDRLLEICKNN